MGARRWVALPLVVASIVVCCRSAPIRNVLDEPFDGRRVATLEDRTRVVVRAGVVGGWLMEEQAPGEITATYRRRGYEAKVKITYDLEHFSIRYVESRNLSAHGDRVHPTYNQWVEKLAADIRRRAASTL